MYIVSNSVQKKTANFSSQSFAVSRRRLSQCSEWQHARAVWHEQNFLHRRRL